MPFQPFSREHLAAVAIGICITSAMLVTAKSKNQHRPLITRILAFTNLAAYPLNLIAWQTHDQAVGLENLLPLHLCDIAAFIAGLALLTGNYLLRTLTYFWGLAATLQALITPAISADFLSPPFISFFVQHFAIVAAAIHIPLVEGWRPKSPLWKSPFDAYLAAFGYMVFSIAINQWLGTNFGFTSRPPENASMIDHLGPWPWYLASFQPLAFTLFFILAIPLHRSRPDNLPGPCE
jgi:hypothetical integral membrane protein (TIGR02206 family)